MGRKLFVGNLPYQLSETELEEAFQQAGQVESVRIMRDMATGRPRGFAFVEMSNDEEAQRAIERLHSSTPWRPDDCRQRGATHARTARRVRGRQARRWGPSRRRQPPGGATGAAVAGTASLAGNFGIANWQLAIAGLIAD